VLIVNDEPYVRAREKILQDISRNDGQGRGRVVGRYVGRNGIRKVVGSTRAEKMKK
jgi:hypothetical protein